MSVERIAGAALNDVVPDPGVPAVVPATTAGVGEHGRFGRVVALASGEVGSRAIAFLATAYAARRLTPSGFGIVGFATAVTAYFALVVRGGVTRVGIREVARDPARAATLALNTVILRLGVAAVAFAALAAAALSLDRPATVRLVVLFAGFTLFSEALDTSWVYNGLERPAAVARSRVLSQLLYAGAIAALVRGPADVTRVPLAQVFGEIVAALSLLVPLLATGAPRLELAAGARVLRATAVPLLTGLVRTVIYMFDVVVLGFVATTAAVGLYTAAYRLCFLLVAVSTAVQSAYLPEISRAAAASGGGEAIRRAAGRSLETTAAVAAPVIVGGILLATPIMTVLFGADYAPGAAALRILLVSVAAIFLHAVSTSILLGTRRVRLELLIMTAGAALNVPLNLFLIPRFGIVGAASATAASEVLILALCWGAVRRLGIHLSARPLLKPAASALVMAAALLVAGRGHRLDTYLVIGGVTYAAVLLGIGGTPADAHPAVRSARSMALRLVSRAR